MSHNPVKQTKDYLASRPAIPQQYNGNPAGQGNGGWQNRQNFGGEPNKFQVKREDVIEMRAEPEGDDGERKKLSDNAAEVITFVCDDVGSHTAMTKDKLVLAMLPSGPDFPESKRRAHRLRFLAPINANQVTWDAWETNVMQLNSHVLQWQADEDGLDPVAVAVKGKSTVLKEKRAAHNMDVVLNASSSGRMSGQGARDALMKLISGGEGNGKPMPDVGRGHVGVAHGVDHGQRVPTVLTPPPPPPTNVPRKIVIKRNSSRITMQPGQVFKTRGVDGNEMSGTILEVKGGHRDDGLVKVIWENGQMEDTSVERFNALLGREAASPDPKRSAGASGELVHVAMPDATMMPEGATASASIEVRVDVPSDVPIIEMSPGGSADH